MSDIVKDKKTLIGCFSEVEDPRDKDSIRHNLIDIIVIGVLAIMCGAEGFNGMEEFGVAKEEWLRKFLELPFGIPSHDTFNTVFSRINPNEFNKCFMEWTSTLYEKVKRELISIDGKTCRRTKCKTKKLRAAHIVSAWANKNRLALGQIKVNDKSNEITAIPELLKLLDIEGCIVSIDSMGTQTKIVDLIVEGGGDYVICLKGNQETLHENVKTLFENEILTKSKKELESENMYCKSQAKDHGRIEKREYYMTKEISSLEQIERWNNLKAVGMVVSQREINDVKSVDVRYYIMSDIKDVKEFAYAARGHWAIENSLHWCLDMGLREDESRARRDNAAENLNMARKIAINLLKKETTSKVGIQNKRLKCGWNNLYLEKVLKNGFII
jgi:predicted transposase YbfD/YdcC